MALDFLEESRLNSLNKKKVPLSDQNSQILNVSLFGLTTIFQSPLFQVFPVNEFGLNVVTRILTGRRAKRTKVKTKTYYILCEPVPKKFAS